MQSNFLGIFVGRVPNALALSTSLFHFPNIARRHCFSLKTSKYPRQSISHKNMSQKKFTDNGPKWSDYNCCSRKPYNS